VERLELRCFESFALARGEERDDAFGFEPVGDDDEGVDRLAVDPVRVVDDAEHRLLLGERGQEAQRARGRRERSNAIGRREAKCRAQCGALPLRHTRKQIENGPQEGAQAGVR
jgi:hypothetical protein